jgi:MFS family permease
MESWSFILFSIWQLAAGFNALQIAVVMGFQIVSLIVSRPFLGRFSDKESRRLPIFLGCFISASLLLIVPFSTEFAVLLTISIGYGLGFAMVISSTTPLMSELTPSNLVCTSMGFLSTVMDIGQTIGPIISGLILASALAYMGLFSSLTILLAVSAAAFFISGIAKAKNEKECGTSSV